MLRMSEPHMPLSLHDDAAMRRIAVQPLTDCRFAPSAEVLDAGWLHRTRSSTRAVRTAFTDLAALDFGR